MEQYDYIVVGAGGSGAVLASRLSEDPGTNADARDDTPGFGRGRSGQDQSVVIQEDSP